jgi:hypothetical protein
MIIKTTQHAIDLAKTIRSLYECKAPEDVCVKVIADRFELLLREAAAGLSAETGGHYEVTVKRDQ